MTGEVSQENEGPFENTHHVELVVLAVVGGELGCQGIYTGLDLIAADQDAGQVGVEFVHVGVSMAYAWLGIQIYSDDITN